MKYLYSVLFFLSLSLNAVAQSNNDFVINYFSSFANKLEEIFSKITESEEEKRLKEDCNLLISDLEELKLGTGKLLVMFEKDTADNWLYEPEPFSDQLENVYKTNRKIRDRIRKIKAKYASSFDGEDIGDIHSMQTGLTQRGGAIDYVGKFLRSEHITSVNKTIILEKVLFIDAKAQAILKEAQTLKTEVLDKI